MRTHVLAMVALLTAALATACSSAREVSDSTAHANAYGCDQCHGYPPPPFFPRGDSSTLPTMFPHAQVTGAMCFVCHPQTVLSDGHTIVAGGEHRDGQVEAVYGTVSDPLPDAATCESCHGLPPDTGRHAFHVSITHDCNTCHKGFDPVARTADGTLHMTGADHIVLENDQQVTKLAGADGIWPDPECADCHAKLGVSGD